MAAVQEPLRLLTHEDLTRHHVTAYFSAPEHARDWETVCAYVDARRLPDGQEPLSLRSLDYFLRVFVAHRPCLTRDQHDVAAAFAQQKSGRRKRAFDPFRRNGPELITFHGRPLLTTWGQLSFFAWCLSSGVLDLAQAHRSEIERDKQAAVPLHGDEQQQQQQQEQPPLMCVPTKTRKRRRTRVAPSAHAGVTVQLLNT